MFPKHAARFCLPLVLFCWCVARVGSGQEFAKEPDRELIALGDKVSQFFKDLTAGDMQVAYKQLLEGSQLAEPAQAKALADLIEKTKEATTKYGEFRAAEQVGLKRVGTDLVLLKYLYKCKDYPVVWYFAFYRSTSSSTTPPETAAWRVVSVRLDTNLELLWY